MALLEGPGTVDVAALARKAVADGAGLLGLAGGDGTQALVAGVAAEHDLPFLVISAGTRNHFALDVCLNRDDPATCLQALTGGEELRVDLGIIGERTFVNNASFGAYAEMVKSPAYRDDKAGTTLQMLPDLLHGHQGARLDARAAGATIHGPQAVLVSNNPYEMTDIAGLGRRARLDDGKLGRGRRPGGQRSAGDRASTPRARPGTDRPGRRRDHRRCRYARDPGRHRRRDGRHAHAGPLRNPAPHPPGAPAAGPARRSPRPNRPSTGPGLGSWPLSPSPTASQACRPTVADRHDSPAPGEDLPARRRKDGAAGTKRRTGSAYGQTG